VGRSLLVVALLVAAACGSTADPSTDTAIPARPGLGAPTQLGPTGAAALPAAPAQPDTPTIAGAPDGDDGIAAPAPAGDAAPATAGDRTTTVSIGVYYVADAQESIDALGAQNDSPSFRNAAEVLIDSINADGGIAGRTIVPVFHGVEATGADRQAEDQAACATFTQDNAVLAVVAFGNTTPEIASCLAAAGVPFVYAGLTIDNEVTFREQPLLSQPISINLDRLARVQAEGLAAQDWFAHAAGSPAGLADLPTSVGVVVFDLPTFRSTYDDVLAPAYAATGHPVAEVAFINARSPASLAADIDAAVLRFASRSITHVSFLTASGVPPGLFMIRATSQRYEPRYGLSSQDAPQLVVPNLPDPEGQLRGALGVGWLPFGDVADATDEGVAAPSHERCVETLADGGVESTDGNSAALLMFVCDALWFLDAAFEAGGGETLSPASFLAGEESMGDGYAPAAIHGTIVGPGRHDGVGAIRHLAFTDDCTCFRYTSATIMV
jgi:hypothetical protein